MTNFISLVKLSAYCAILLISGQMEAQRYIKGQITDEQTNEPIIGANVIEPGTRNGTITDIDGAFSLTVSENTAFIEISYIGYNDVQLDIRGQEKFMVSMTSGEVLEEVVVIGYGTVKREDATGAVQTVTAADFNKGALTGPQELLAGKVPGVNINTGADPGGGSKIRIRGESSLNASNDPLIVIDGVPLDNTQIAGNRNPLDIINPNDIESFTVLKDASATAIYGNRAAGGVILITTKKGKADQKLSVAYNGNVSVGTITNRIEVLDADEYRDIIREIHGEESEAYMVLGDANTDWQDEIYQNATGTEHNLNFSGGVKQLPYRLSLGYINKNGILKTDNYQRSSLGVNLNPSFLDNRLQVNVGLKSIWSNNHFADRGAIVDALSFDPTQTVRDPNSAYGGFTTWLDASGNPQFLSPTNPVAKLELKDDESTVNRYIVNASADYRFSFMPALRANLNLALDQLEANGSVTEPTFAAFSFDPQFGGGKNNTYNEQKNNRLLEYYMNYKKGFGIHDVDLMAGYSWQRFAYEKTFRDSDAAGSESKTVEGVDKNELYLISLFSRLNYNLLDRYLFTFSLRRDGTSRFAEGSRWGLFPAAALAVKIIEKEDARLNRLKLRTGWGVTGQENLDKDEDYNRYASLPRYTFGFSTAAYQVGDEFVTTLRPEGYDSELRWETTTTYNIGLDFGLFNDRLSGYVDLYRRDTKDLLNRIPVPAGTNLTNFVTTNIGNMTNNGVEVALFTKPISTKNLNWDLGFNVSRNVNEITKLTATDDPEYIGILTGGIAGGVGSNIQIHSVGYAPFSFYVKEQLYDEEGNILEGEFADLDGDGISNDNYRYKNPAPEYAYGITSSLGYKALRLSFAGRAQTGNYVYNNVLTNIGYLNRLVSSQNTLYNVHSEAVELDVYDQGNLTFSDHFIQEASFFRLDHVTLSTDISSLTKFNAGLSFTVQNPLVITRYTGVDPEASDGIDNDTYPRARTYVLGFNAQF